GERTVEFGCGVGGVMLCLASRVPGVSIVGLEIQPELAELCRKNVERNKMQGLEVRQGDVTSFSETGFDHVFMNPPYHDEARHDVSSNASMRTANADKDGDLKLWIESVARALKPTGDITIIHRADRKDEIVGLLQKHFNSIRILPLLPKEGVEPKRIILRASTKTGGVMLCKPLILHKAEGGYTAEADRILRDAEALDFTPA
ncbi:MAG TPA: methyltransferase, partial [Alphaproteobacteria bacterium]|nr:methyltransferase [Alphaproteobacteria bacterium]